MVASFLQGRGSDISAGGGMSYREVGDSPLLPSLCLREPLWLLALPAGPAAHPAAHASPCGESHLLSRALSRISGPATHFPIQEVMVTWQPWPLAQAMAANPGAWPEGRTGAELAPCSPRGLSAFKAWSLGSATALRPASSGFEDWRVCDQTQLQRLPAASPHPEPWPGPPLH